MKNETENKEDVVRLRIFALLVFVVMISGAALVTKYGKSSNYKNMNKLEYLVR